MHRVFFPGVGAAVQEVCGPTEEDREMRANSITHTETIRVFYSKGDRNERLHFGCHKMDSAKLCTEDVSV